MHMASRPAQTLLLHPPHAVFFTSCTWHCINFFSPHVVRMAFVVKQNAASDLPHVNCFGPETVMLGAHSVAHLIKLFRLLAALPNVNVMRYGHTFDGGRII
jgi:hypothetical protein